ncbi:MAG: prolyl oligopeptidase [Planctomycetota bacterium]|nr:MAG: prolyl oligopeptidase [Planctomycetota bacterium]REJ92262.1 MAG: prolyl oligopeptidase [Planctomycetota bacterium]REK29757.1 MAG: prolyl oligopeptidase [Planctomycetota bacterium]REK30422.1 MAG: prolyl oligopeptidase [Planctomycetota bacterium]
MTVQPAPCRPSVRIARVLLLLAATVAPRAIVRAADVLPELREIEIESSQDGSLQPSRIWAPDTADATPTPLLISLHSWSGDYLQDRSRWLAEAADRGWVYIQPNFRGRNDHPEACGSKLARHDVLDALDWCLSKYSVDEERIYLAGASGGGHMTMLMAARHPDRFSAVSAWVGISDLAAWYQFHLQDGEPQRYAQMIALCCGGPPGASPEVDREYRERSPIFWLHDVGDLHIDLNAGVTDGKTGSVPIRHTIDAFNVIAAAGSHPTVTESEIEQLVADERLTNPRPSDVAVDDDYDREIYLRRTAGPARVTIFDGGHEALPAAACAWLDRQSRPTIHRRDE